MNIAMFSNTYLPHIGGVARSVSQFSDALRKLGHQVLIIAPEFPDMPSDEVDVLRVPAIQRFNGSDFSVKLPIPPFFLERLHSFAPEIIHSHHPFLLGDTALRLAAELNIPLVFTHHTMYEQYTHYVPADSPELKRFAIELATGYANLCNLVISPSESIKQVLLKRGVDTEILAIPTGVQLERFVGDGQLYRTTNGIPQDAFVIGHVGRLAPEKNLLFMAEAVKRAMLLHRHAVFLLVGEGPLVPTLVEFFKAAGLRGRFFPVGARQGQDLVNAYNAMNVFAFASHSETQGMVLLEAMSAGVPVVALDAPGAREIVQTGENGLLLSGQNSYTFAQALSFFATLAPTITQNFRTAAKLTASQFSLENTTVQLVAAYQKVLAQSPSSEPIERTTWAQALRKATAEWELAANKTLSARSALLQGLLSRFVVLKNISRHWSTIRRNLSRAEWNVRLLRLWRSTADSNTPGLIILQIDGLSRPQLERAMHQGKMPFLRQLLRREGYELHSIFSGIPSSTPAVQGELFYGQPAVVPAFSFFQRANQKVVRMLEPESAAEIEAQLAAQRPGLLRGGSSYSNIYSGGAEESHFCPATFGLDYMLGALNPWSWIGFVLWHGKTIVLCVLLALLETFLALFDCLNGLIKGKELKKELLFVPTRVAVSIMLREMVTAGVCVDIARGFPIIHANFLGYDEQAHRRGPSSFFAHWALKGIDAAIRRIWNSTHLQSRREYEVWVISDHGQEHTLPYPQRSGRTIHQAVQELFAEGSLHLHEPQTTEPNERIAHQRARWLFGSKLDRWLTFSPAAGRQESPYPVVTAFGPLAHLYLGRALTEAEKEEIAVSLREKAEVPLVLFIAQNGVQAWNAKGRFTLPADAAEVLGTEHPFLQACAEDLAQICQHENAGDFVLSGWAPAAQPLSFPEEHGAHGGPGSQETHAFALLPSWHSARLNSNQVNSAQVISNQLNSGHLRTAKVLRFGDLSRLANDIVSSSLPQRNLTYAPRLSASGTLRVMSYNVHSCIGMDGLLSPSRIARLIAQYAPDVIALQELDLGRSRSEYLDQAHLIAEMLEMEFHFFPTLQVEEERYGDAILCRYPLRLVAADVLPFGNGRNNREPRGVIWTEVTWGDVNIQCLNTHLGLSHQERLAQVDALSSTRWLQHPQCTGPVVFCGDFNASPGSQVYQRLTQHLRDTHQHVIGKKGKRPDKTWLGKVPMRRIDYIFASAHFEVVDAFVVRTDLSKSASDHLPVVADLRLIEKTCDEEL